MISQSPQPTNSWIVIGFLLAGLGIPAGVATAFNEQLAKKPILLGLLLAVWMIGLGIVSLLTPVFSTQRERLAIAINGWIGRTVHGFASRYRQHLLYRHRNLDVKGLSTRGTNTLEIKNVFVELEIAPQTLHNASTGMLRRSRHTFGAPKSIWSYLREFEGKHLAIIGPPGSGKTTLLKHMALVLASPKKWHRLSRSKLMSYSNKRPLDNEAANGGKLIPILLFLRNYSADIAEGKEYSLIDAIEDDLGKRDLQAPLGWFRTHLRSGKCLVMLDGLDEVADEESRQGVSRWVERQIESYPNNRFIVTSRPHGYRSSQMTLDVLLEVQPFTREQIECFVNDWYLANEVMDTLRVDPGIEMDAKEGAKDLLDRLRNAPTLAELAVNPLLLTMIATVHRYRSSLPGRRVELYSEVCEVFLGKRQQAKKLAQDLTPPQKVRVLRTLAFAMMVEKKREASLGYIESKALSALRSVLKTEKNRGCSSVELIADFVKEIETGSGLLVEREVGTYGFAHLAFQEYLAALHIKETQSERVLLGVLGKSWWHETTRLYAAQSDATAIIHTCLSLEPATVEKLVLAIECIEEALEVKPELREQLDKLLIKGVEDKDPLRRKLVSEALLALRIRRMTRVSETTYIDSTYVSHAEYQLFLDQERESDEYCQPDHWIDYRFPNEMGTVPVVGVRPADGQSYCDWLNERYPMDGWRFRLPYSSELAEQGMLNSEQTEEARGHWVMSKSHQSQILYETNGRPAPIIPSEHLQLVMYPYLLLLLGGEGVRAGANERALAYARARALERALPYTSDIDINGLLDLDSELKLVLCPESNPDRNLKLDLELIRDRDLNLDLSLVLDYGLDRNGYIDLSRKLGPESGRAFGLDCYLDRDLDLDRHLGRHLDFAFNPNHDLEFNLSSKILEELPFLSDRAELSKLASRSFRVDSPDWEFWFAGARALSQASNLVSFLAADMDRTRMLDFEERDPANHHRYASFTALASAVALQTVLDLRKQTKRGWRNRVDEKAVELGLARDQYLLRFADYCILEERRKGHLPAFEGLRIVRERVEKGTSVDTREKSTDHTP